MTRALDHPELNLALALHEGALKAYMLLLSIDPVPESPTLPQPQFLDVPERVGKWHNAVPVPTVQVDPDAGLGHQPGVLVHAASLVFVIQVVDGLVAG